MTRVHLTLPRHLLSDPVQLRYQADQIVRATGMTDVNEQRLYRYAILTGSVQNNKLAALDALDADVVFEIDAVRRAAS